MRNLATVVSATLTAVILGLVIANVSSAARAADAAHATEQRAAEVDAAQAQSDVTSQLVAYRARYSETYQQLAAAYQTLAARDAQYRAALQSANAQSASLASANASLAARLSEAYQALYDAQAVVAALEAAPASAPAPRAETRPAPLRAPAAAAPAPASRRWDDGRLKCGGHDEEGDD